MVSKLGRQAGWCREPMRPALSSTIGAAPNNQQGKPEQTQPRQISTKESCAPPA